MAFLFPPCRHLARNPFHCDCQLSWMVDWMGQYPVETSGARCEGPKRMHKRKLSSLRQDQLKCYGKMPKKSYIYGRSTPWPVVTVCIWQGSLDQEHVTQTIKGVWTNGPKERLLECIKVKLKLFPNFVQLMRPSMRWATSVPRTPTALPTAIARATRWIAGLATNSIFVCFLFVQNHWFAWRAN